MKKVLFVATVVKTHINVFHIPYLKMLKDMGFETHVAAKNDFENQEECVIPYCDVYHDIPFERNPFNKRNIVAYRQLKMLMINENFDIVHCHTPVGGALTRLVYKNINSKINTKCIYTAHGFHFYKGAPLLNWMVYYPIEKYLSKYTDVLITINKEDYFRAKKNFNMGKLEYIPGVGVDEQKFKLSNFDKNEIREKLGLKDNDYMLLSVGELIPRKNHKIVIEAISSLNNDKLHYYIVGRGILKDELEDYIKKLNLQKQIHLLGFREDIAELDTACDLFIFPSKQEGLPVAVMEAIMCNTLCVVSDIRGNHDLITDGKNGFLFRNNNLSEIKKVIIKSINISERMRMDMVNNNAHIKLRISLDNIKSKYKKIYIDNSL